MRADEVEWEVLGTLFSVNIVGLGARQLKSDRSWQQGQLGLVVRRSGYGMVYGLCAADGVPVELARRDGEVVGARIEYVDNAAELEASGEGEWRLEGQLRIGSAGAVVRCLADGPEWGDRVPIPEGRYRAETFFTPDEPLGIRLLRDDR